MPPASTLARRSSGRFARRPHKGTHVNTDAETVANDRDYTYRLGALHASLGTLELALRTTLYLMDTPKADRLPPTFRIASLAAGAQLPESWLTKWAYLSNFIEEYNKRQLASGLAAIDSSIVDLRNELAHGVISAQTQHDPFTLVRFGKAQNGVVTVLAQWEMTPDWLSDQIRRVNDALIGINARLMELR
jgi:hypothetical protein